MGKKQPSPSWTDLLSNTFRLRGVKKLSVAQKKDHQSSLNDTFDRGAQKKQPQKKAEIKKKSCNKNLASAEI